MTVCLTRLGVPCSHQSIGGPSCSWPAVSSTSPILQNFQSSFAAREYWNSTSSTSTAQVRRRGIGQSPRLRRRRVRRASLRGRPPRPRVPADDLTSGTRIEASRTNEREDGCTHRGRSGRCGSVTASATGPLRSHTRRMGITRRAASRAAASVGAMVLTMCGCSGAQPGATGLARDEAPSFVQLDVAADEEFFPDAIMSGELRVVDGCLLLGRAVPVWTADFVWDAAEQVVTWPTGHLAMGDIGTFGGGREPAGSEADAVLLDDQAPETIARCVQSAHADYWTYITP